jgi:L,D-transpeptidase YbiS
MLLWLLVFAAAVQGVSNAVSELSRTEDALRTSAAALERNRLEMNAVLREADAYAEELAFLHGLTDILPQDKSSLRTQKAISDEVQALRRKIGRKIGDRLHIVVDTKANKLYLKQGLTLLWQADCSVGRGGILVDKTTGRTWEFVTPRGEFRIQGKIENKVWIKPDWAFTEAGQPIPPPDDPSRRVEGELGRYALDLGDGYLIHGTKNEKALGSAVSHGCVRLGAPDLEKLYQTVPIGTKAYIY